MSAQSGSGNRNLIIIIVVVVVLLCCCCLAVAGAYYYIQLNPGIIPSLSPTPTTQVLLSLLA